MKLFDERSIAKEERMLQAAAYIICAYLTAVRDSEQQADTRGSAALIAPAPGSGKGQRAQTSAHRATPRRATRITKPISDAAVSSIEAAISRLRGGGDV
jgi:hypothetical protein